jgi:glycine/D-amino acid oxidase-like deaminating enzyme
MAHEWTAMTVGRETRADVVIIGAGIVGCATAWHLARRGVAVRVLERDAIASEQSSRAWGFVRQQGRHPAEIPLAAAALALWPELSTTLGADVEFVRSGILVPAESDADEARLDAAARVAREHGVDSRIVNGAEIARLVPGAARGWRSGLYTPGDGHAEPAKATRAFADAARRLGVDIVEHTAVLGFEVAGNRIHGVTSANAVHRADVVVCTAGIGAADLGRTLGVSLPIQVVRASVAQTRPTAATFQTAVWSPRVAFRPRRDGTFYVSNGYRGTDAEHDLTLDSFRHLPLFFRTYLANRDVVKPRLGRELVADLVRRLRPGARFRAWGEPRVSRALVRHHERRFYEVFPHLAGLGIARSWAGRIDATPDLIPIIGTPAGAPMNLVVAAGFNGHGFALAPIVGRLLAELVTGGAPSLDLHRFRPSRFAEGDAKPEVNAL